MNANTNIDEMLSAVANAMVETERPSIAQGPVTLPAALANDVFRLLRDLRIDLAYQLRRAGSAIAAGDCNDCKLAFFADHFGDAVIDVGGIAGVRVFSKHVIEAYQAACANAAPAAEPFATWFTAEEIRRQDAQGSDADLDGTLTIGLRNEYYDLDARLGKLTPILDSDGPLFVAYARRAQAIERELAHRKQTIPFAAANSIKSNIARRRHILVNEWRSLTAIVRDIDASTIAGKPSQTDAQKRLEAVRRIADIRIDYEALTGQAAPSSSDQTDDLIHFAKRGGPIADPCDDRN